jgi:thiamine transport system substrate-binding protein
MEMAMSLFSRCCLGTLLMLSLLPGAAAAVPTLTVYTYDSFTSDWGPGPQVREAFEARCACKLELIGLEDGVSILNRLRLEGANTRADLLLGIDTSLTAEARATGLFEAHGLELENSALPGAWRDELFLPYDYGYFAFVYDRERLRDVPASLRELVEDENGPTLLIQDPRTSTPGLGLLLWMRKVFGDAAGEAWAKLSPRIVTVSKGWSEAYGLFLKQEADMVLSYSTSPAYHLIAEQEARFAAARFAEGHYQQVEVAGLVRGSDNATLARDFLHFMISEDFQAIIPTTNWMYPAALPRDRLPPEFGELIDPSPPLLFDADEVMQRRRQWVDDWLEVMSR